MKTILQSSEHGNSCTLVSCQWTTITCQGNQSGIIFHENSNSSYFHSPFQSHILPRSRHKHCAVLGREYVFIIAGKDGTIPLKDMWKFHIKQHRWEKVQVLGCSLPFLQGHTAVIHKHIIYIFGGTFSDSLGDVQLWTYSIDVGLLQEVWIEPGNPQPKCRRDHSAVVYNNNMYVYGGFCGSAGSSKEFWAYSFEGEKWREIRIPTQLQPGKRHGHSAVVADNAMWVFGGMADLMPLADLWLYSFTIDQWKRIKGHGAPPFLTGHTANVIHRQMIIVGGTSKGRPVRDVWAFHLDTATWQKLQTNGITCLPSLHYHTSVLCITGTFHSGLSGRAHSTQSQSNFHIDSFVPRPLSSPSVTLNRQTLHRSDRNDGPYLLHNMSNFDHRKNKIMIVNHNISSSADADVNSLTGIWPGSALSNSDRMDAQIDVSDEQLLLFPKEKGEFNSIFLWRRRKSLPLKTHYAEMNVFSVNADTSLSSDLHTSVSAPERLSIGRQHAEFLSPERLSIGRQHAEFLSPEKTNQRDWTDAVPHFEKREEESRSVFHADAKEDIYLEDLEMSDLHHGLDDLKISYPSRNPFLPLLSHTDGPESSCWYENSTQQQKDQLIELEDLGQKSCANDSWRLSPVSPGHLLELSSSICENRDPLSQPYCQQNLRSLVPVEHNQTDWSSYGYLARSTKSPFTVQEQAESVNKQKDAALEPNSSSKSIGIQTDFSALSKNDAGFISGSLTSQSHAVPATEISHHNNQHIANLDADNSDALESSEPFVLVMGGCSEEIRFYLQPLTVWKGVFF